MKNFIEEDKEKKESQGYEVVTYYIINIPEGCLNACDISEISTFTTELKMNEQEVLIPPYSVFKIENIIENQKPNLNEETI